MKKAGSVDAYIAAVPRDVKSKLKQLRRIIKSAAPKADEKISYGIPYYAYNGGLAYFAVFKKHISLFVMPSIVAEHKKELRRYETTKSAVHFPHGRPLPVALIKKLVKAGIRKNEAKKK